LWKTFQLVLLQLLWGCSGQDELLADSDPITNTSVFVSAVDISGFPEIAASQPTFFDASGNSVSFLDELKKNGINTIRLRLWVHPKSGHSDLTEVQSFSGSLKEKGFKTWITVHYSDTWADPGKQEIPDSWQSASFEALKDSVLNYTRKVARELQPDIIQIGNEINSGLLHPFGKLSENPEQFRSLLGIAIGAVRSQSPTTRIMLHYAGLSESEWFYNQVKQLDYDLIGISYYPLWHGKSLQIVKSILETLIREHNKPVLIAETAYPFTLEWQDKTNNIVGLEEQLILPKYPASPQGQLDFVSDLKAIVQSVQGGIGLSYWGAEWIAWKGSEATDGSPWENQAVFDFENRALPVLSVLGAD
jgi:arabinogalactan endo-1,4-beta-galactosidase